MTKAILGYKCKKCGALHYPYRMVCKACKSLEHDNFEAVPLPNKGSLVTFTELYTLPGDFNVSTIGLGIVKLENGLAVTGQIKIDQPKIGMKVTGRVEPVRQSDYSESFGMVFYQEK
jgi:hypothetical protein